MQAALALPHADCHTPALCAAAFKHCSGGTNWHYLQCTFCNSLAVVCLQLVIYGIDGVLVPEMELVPFSDEFLQYLEVTLMPGSAEVPLGLIMSAVQAGDVNTVAMAADEAVNMGYLQQLTALVTAASGNVAAIQSLAAVGNEMIMMTSCAKVTPLIQQANPFAASLGVSNSTLTSIGKQYPALTACVMSQ